jgi:DNA-binding XRE family transcriptional regulator
VALYLLRVDAGLSAGDAARLFGRARTDVVYLTGNVARALARSDSWTDVVASARRDLRRRVAERMPEPMPNDPPTQQPMLFVLAKRRMEAGLTQAQLAKRAGVARETVIRIETLQRPARLAVRRALAQALEIGLDRLMEEPHPVVRPGQPADNLPTDTTRHFGRVATDRQCTDCMKLKPRSAFVPIAGTHRVYGRCRVCRARRARERYWADARFREAERARARQKRLRANGVPTAGGATLESEQGVRSAQTHTLHAAVTLDGSV